MEEAYKEAACFTVDKYHLSKLKDDEAFKEFIIKDLTNKLADHLVDVLSSEGEILVKMSDVSCYDDDDFTVDYRRYLKWSHLVRCKDCIYGIPARIDIETHEFSDERYCNRHHRMCPFENYYCADGKRKETEDAEIC